MTSRTAQTTDLPELAQLLNDRISELSPRKSQGEIATEAGFTSKNVLSIIKNGGSKLAMDRVESTAKALEIPVEDLVIPALRQYYTEDVLEMIANALVRRRTNFTKTELELVAIARGAMDTNDNLSFESRELIKEVLRENKPAGA